MPREGASGWPLAEAVRSATMLVVDDLADRFDAVPRGPWSDPPNTAVLVPLRSTQAEKLAGVLVAGVSSRLDLDERYRDFLELVAAQIATAIASARAYEEERRRAEALAEIDRAKTAFFSNASHEFRTPLTLLLSPLEDLLLRCGSAPNVAADRAELELMHRNGLRLLKLVNSLLDFSRIEAGRFEAVYEPVDLAALYDRSRQHLPIGDGARRPALPGRLPGAAGRRSTSIATCGRRSSSTCCRTRSNTPSRAR